MGQALEAWPSELARLITAHLPAEFPAPIPMITTGMAHAETLSR